MPQRKVGRNDPCPCGSGKKYKNCCAKSMPAPNDQPPTPGTASPPTATVEPTFMATLRQATVLHEQGRLREAQGLYEQVVKQQPDHARALIGLGDCLGRLGNLQHGVKFCQRAIEIDGSRAEYHAGLSNLLYMMARCDESLESALNALKVDEKCVPAHCLVSSNYEQMQRYDEAAEHLEKALTIVPGDPYVSINLAHIEFQQEKYVEAKDRLDAVLQMPNLRPEYRQKALHELGMVQDQLENYDAAFEAFTQNGQVTERLPLARNFNRARLEQRISAYQRGIDGEPISKVGPEDLNGMRSAPTFLVGFPRSGTTMLEQVLAAHPKIVTADEQSFIDNMRIQWIKMVGGNDDARVMLDRLDREQVLQLRQRYWDQVEKALPGLTTVEDHIFVDKLPLNLIDLSLIDVVFPDAKVLVALRDPRDVCLSCLMQEFRLNDAMIHFLTLDSTVAFYTKVMDLYLAVRDRLTAKTLEVRYEDTVADLEMQARRVLDFLNVEWDTTVLDFHEKAKERYVSTPSFSAVAEPVYTRAAGRWRHYEKHFESYQTPLLPFVEAFGYGA